MIQDKNVILENSYFWSMLFIENCHSGTFIQQTQTTGSINILAYGTRISASTSDAALRPRDGFSHPHQEHMKDTYILVWCCTLLASSRASRMLCLSLASLSRRSNLARSDFSIRPSTLPDRFRNSSMSDLVCATA